MMELMEKTCTPCRGGIPPLPEEQAMEWLTKTKGWQLQQKGTRLFRRFEYRNFREAWEAVEQLATLAEEQGHHPDIRFGWGYLEVTWYTHKIDGLHENDFIMAARTDQRLGVV